MIYVTVASCGAADHWSAGRILRLTDQHVSWSCLHADYRRTSLSLITGLVKVSPVFTYLFFIVQLLWRNETDDDRNRIPPPGMFYDVVSYMEVV